MQLKPAPVFPDMDSNYQATVVIPQQEAAKAAQDALDAAAALEAQVAPPPVESSYAAPTQATGQFVDSLMGSIGYALSSGNCVLEVPPAQRLDGNPISWPTTTQTPYIGAIALFPYNHVAVVTGLWSNGDIEVRQQNWGGVPQTRFPRSSFRGFR